MYAKYTKQQKFDMIMECRSSGLSDYQWCRQNGISSSSFYSRTRQFMREGASLPKAANKETYKSAVKQDIVELEIIDDISLPIDSNLSSKSNSAIEIIFGKATVKISNDTNPELLTHLIRCLGECL